MSARALFDSEMALPVTVSIEDDSTTTTTTMEEVDDDDFENDNLAHDLENDLIEAEAETATTSMDIPTIELPTQFQSVSPLTHEQKEFFDYCKELENNPEGASATATAEKMAFVIKLKTLMAQCDAYITKDKAMYFIVDMLKRALSCDDAERSGNAQVVCRVSGLSVPETETCTFTIKVPLLSPRSLIVHKKYRDLIYSFFYLNQFQNCMTYTIRSKPDLDDATIKKCFEKVEECAQYVAYHVPSNGTS
jgi:hypothetical protein